MVEDDLVETFKTFRDECIDIRITQEMYENLYCAGERVQDLLKSTAGLFFDDLNKILIDQFYLKVCRITDPPKMGGRDNLTIKHINGLLNNRRLLTKEIEEISTELEAYSEKLRPARNRKIAHLDKQVAFSEEIFGAHGADEYHRFYVLLQKYADQVGEAVGEGPLDFLSVSGPGDTMDLLKTLDRGRKAVGETSKDR